MKGRLAEIRFERHGEVVLAALDGEVDSSNAGELLSALGAGVPADVRGLALDVAKLSYLDSAGIEMVFSLAGRLRTRRQRLAIAVPKGAPVGRVLDISGVESVADVVADVDSAIASLTG